MKFEELSSSGRRWLKLTALFRLGNCSLTMRKYLNVRCDLTVKRDVIRYNLLIIYTYQLIIKH